MTIGPFDVPKVVSASVAVAGLFGSLLVFSMSRASTADIEKVSAEAFSRRDGERLERAIEKFAVDQQAILRIVLDVQADQRVFREQREADRKK